VARAVGAGVGDGRPVERLGILARRDDLGRGAVFAEADIGRVAQQQRADAGDRPTTAR
jgi:hypothetical protein